MEDKINQILMNQATIMVALASLYADDCESVEVLEQLNRRNSEIQKLFSPTKPRIDESKLKVPKKISFDIKDKDGKKRKVTFKSRRGSHPKPLVNRSKKMECVDCKEEKKAEKFECSWWGQYNKIPVGLCSECYDERIINGDVLPNRGKI